MKKAKTNVIKFIALFTTMVVSIIFQCSDMRILLNTNTSITAHAVNTDYLANYIRGLVGTEAKEWGDAGVSTQCVELVKYYIEQLWGVSTKNQALGNGNAMYYRVAEEYPQYFTSIAYYDGLKLMPGDIISYHSNDLAADYGHAALVYEVNGNSYKIAEQWQYCGTVQSNSKTVKAGIYGTPYTIIGIARPKDDTNPTITNVYISDLDSTGYTVNCTAIDDSGISSVKFPTWTTKTDGNGNDQDDIVWGIGTRNGDTYSYRVNISDHNNEIGDYITHIYAYDFGGNYTSFGLETVTPKNDTNKPTISDIRIIDMSGEGYTISCKVSDDVGIAHVKFPTWTEKEGQNDIIWGLGTYNGENEYRYRVNASDHNGERINYITHIYATDFSGNYESIAVDIQNMTDEPVIRDVYVSDIDSTGYTVNCTVSDKTNGIDRVEFPTWTTKTDSNGNDQDDIIWGKGTANGSSYSYRVNISEHNNESGYYRTHIYAWDTLGNGFSVTVPDVFIENQPPVISDIRIIEKDSTGYTVQCTVVDEGSGIERVEFPTWTTKTDENGNDQDDIIWGTGTPIDSTLTTYTYRVNISEHSNELGYYRTHIYAYDNCGNSTSIAVDDVLITDPIIGDCNDDGEFNISDVVLLQKWLLAVPDIELANWKAADLCEDYRLDVFDLCLMKRMLVENSKKLSICTTRENI